MVWSGGNRLWQLTLERRVGRRLQTP
jgi:hypothetical protein